MSGLQDPSPLEREFELHLKRSGKKPGVVSSYMRTVRRFLKHVGTDQVERIGEDLTRGFFSGIKNPNTRRTYSMAIEQLLRFAAARMPVLVVGTEGPAMAPVPAVKDRKELALRRTWAVDRLLEQKSHNDDLIAKLARKVIDHYVYFQGRMRGDPENLDDVYRYADECKELIESNFELFMALSKSGRNIHSAIDERVQR